MKQISGFQCELCNSVYESDVGALDCEKSHTSIDSVRITRMRFNKVQGSYGPQRGMNAKVPSDITVKFSDSFGDFGIYVLTQYGPRGL